jgi:hypothetical protein
MRPLMAAPGPSRTGASWEATGLGARNLSWRGKTAAEDEGWRSMGQPHTSCRWDASLPDATTVSPAPPASRSPGGRGRRQPHGRAVWPRRCHSPPPCRQHHLPTAAREGAGGASRTVVPFGRVVVPGPPTRPAPTTRPNESLRRGTRLAASTTSTWLVHRAGSAGNDAPKRHECAAGAARALSGCGWQVVLPTLLVASGNDAAKRHECAAGAARALSGCGWQLVRPASSASVSARYHKLRAPSPVASHDAQVREGPGAAVWSAGSSFVHECAALGPAAASCSRAIVRSAHVCSDGRARRWTRT